MSRFHSVAEAAAAQNADYLLDMIQRGEDVNAQDEDGNTALHWCAWFRMDHAVSKLVEAKARLDLGNTSSETPIHWAAKAANLPALTAMSASDYGVLAHRDCDGFSPFIILAQNDNPGIMEWMYLRGASVEEQDKWGRSALQWACYKGHRRTVQWLLSRSADVGHRDHEGMTAIHWAALKGFETIAESLIAVGAVHLLDVPDAAGDTPIRLAHRKKNRYLVMSFFKCQFYNLVCGRPNISQNNFANLFVAFVLFNLLVFSCVIAPGIVTRHILAMLGWFALILGTMILWTTACWSDPGWLAERTLVTQAHILQEDPVDSFDARQPVESQMVAAEAFSQANQAKPNPADLSRMSALERLENEQKRYNYQRHLIQKARARLEDAAGPEPPTTSRTETQPLVSPRDAGSLQHQQLDKASFDLRERMRGTGQSLGRERTAKLLSRGLSEYVELLDKGSFKQVCVVCRCRREMRSHHCKECGRCVQRLDHHCPWIDNCVGLGNQRIFFLFILLLWVTILDFYYVALLYLEDDIAAVWRQGELVSNLRSVFIVLISTMRPTLVFTACLFNVVWMTFVTALVFRHTAYMIVNVTTYEVLVRPNHVQRRFPRSAGRLWFMHDCTPISAFQNCVKYWTLDTEHDAMDFAPSEAHAAMSASEGEASRGDRTYRTDSQAGPSPLSRDTDASLRSRGTQSEGNSMRSLCAAGKGSRDVLAGAAV